MSGIGVFGPGGVAQPVHGLDAPLAAGDPREVGGAGTVRVEAGDGVHDFLADQGAVVAVAADPRDPGDMREVQAAGIGDPYGAADDPAVAVVQFRVVRLAGAVVLDGVEDGLVRGRLVALDEQEVVRSAVPVLFLAGDAVRGLPLRVGGVGGDHRAFQVHGLQQLLQLGGLGGLVRDPVLRDHDLVLVQHRGEQLDLAIGDAAQPFPVDRDRVSSPPCRPVSARARSHPPMSSSSISAPMAWMRVRTRFSLGAMIRRSSGCGFPPSLARISCGRSAAWSPISRKLFAPASTHATATASTNTST
jgi:hypothetical protein